MNKKEKTIFLGAFALRNNTLTDSNGEEFTPKLPKEAAHLLKNSYQEICAFQSIITGERESVIYENIKRYCMTGTPVSALELAQKLHASLLAASLLNPNLLESDENALTARYIGTMLLDIEFPEKTKQNEQRKSIAGPGMIINLPETASKEIETLAHIGKSPLYQIISPDIILGADQSRNYERILLSSPSFSISLNAHTLTGKALEEYNALKRFMSEQNNNTAERDETIKLEPITLGTLESKFKVTLYPKSPTTLNIACFRALNTPNLSTKTG